MSGEKIEYLGEEIQRLKFLMRSGNFFMVDGVHSWSMRHQGNRVVGLTLKQSLEAQYARVIVESIDLDQIEAVVILPASGPGRRANEKEGGRG
jgi:hypothetical protein